jgi:hypothetical protein
MNGDIMRALMLFLFLFAANPDGLQSTGTSTPSLLLVESDHKPHISIGWTTDSGERRVYEADRVWGADADRTPIGGNISAYVAVGGTRLQKGAGHPKGAIIRVGFYKINPDALFFDGVTAASVIDVEMRGVRFNQPVMPMTRTIIQHLKFSREALVSCRIPSNAWSLYNTVNRHETLNGRARPGYDTRLGALAGENPGEGSATATVETDGTVTIRASIPYALFKHMRDPWQRAIPGTFLEPIHFHVEIEVLPEAVAAAAHEKAETKPGD